MFLKLWTEQHYDPTSYFKLNQYPWCNNKSELSPQASLTKWFTAPGNPINTEQKHLVISHYSLHDIFAYTYNSFLSEQLT